MSASVFSVMIIMQFNATFSHVVTLSANTYCRDTTIVLLNLNVYEAGAAHLKALLADYFNLFCAGNQVMAHEIASQGSTGRTRRRVFHDSQCRGKHTTVNGGFLRFNLACEH